MFDTRNRALALTIARRTVSTLITLLGVAIIVFVILRLLPGDAITASLGVNAGLLSPAQQELLKADGAILEYGPATGFIVKFTNGLTAYLTGDTGIHSEMKTVVNEFHKANLAVLNLGNNPGIYISGAHAMNDLVRPASVILTHPNEPVTEGGKVRPASRTAARGASPGWQSPPARGA